MDRFREPFEFPFDTDEQVNTDGDGKADLGNESSEQFQSHLPPFIVVQASSVGGWKGVCITTLRKRVTIRCKALFSCKCVTQAIAA